MIGVSRTSAWAFGVALLGCAFGCTPAPSVAPPAPVAVEASVPEEAPPRRGGPCESLRAVADEASRLLARHRAPTDETSDDTERAAPVLIALADDLGERHVAEVALQRWRDAYRVTLYELALVDRIDGAPDGGQAPTTARARWWGGLSAEAQALGAALTAHCAEGRALDVPRLVDPPTETPLILTETDEAYRLHRVAEGIVSLYDRTGDRESFLPHLKERLARVHVEQPEVAAARAGLLRLLDDLGSGEGARAEETRRLVERLVIEIGTLWNAPLPDYLADAERERCREGRDRSCTRLAIHLQAIGAIDEVREIAGQACGPAALHACALASATAFRGGSDERARQALAEHESLCRQGLAGACATVALLLGDGRIGPADPSRARALWLRLCSEVGGEASCARLMSDPDADAEAAWTRACDVFGTASACRLLERELF